MPDIAILEGSYKDYIWAYIVVMERKMETSVWGLGFGDERFVKVQGCKGNSTGC